MSTQTTDKTIDEITAFWLGESLHDPEAASTRREWWYDGGTAVDDEIRSRFGALIPRACDGELSDWETTSNGALALILLLDQFTRNIHRGTPDVYLGDPRAFEVVNRAIDNGLDKPLHPVARIWLYHPLHHAEQVEDHDRGIALMHDMLKSAPREWHPNIERSITGWGRHRDIVARFGRFPHRNAILGRASTEEERAFMEDGGESFGQGRR